MLVGVDQALAALARHRDRDDLVGKRAALDRRARARQRLRGVGVLVGAGEAVMRGGGLAEIAHRASRFVRIFQAVEHHVVEDAVVADAVAGARLGQQVRRVGHRLHAAGNDHVGRAGAQQVVRQHRRLHARAADLVDRGRADRVGQAGPAHRLPCGRLALAGGQHAAHQHFVDAFRRQVGALQRGADDVRAQCRRGYGRQVAQETAQRRAHGGDDDNGIGFGHGRNSGGEEEKRAFLARWVTSPVVRRPAAWTWPMRTEHPVHR